MFAAPLTLPLLVGCQPLPLDQVDETSRDQPFTLSLVETQACPLPTGVDPKEKRILGVKVKLESEHPGRIGANYFYGSLLTKDGDRYLAELGGCHPILSQEPLGPGESAEGFLNFPLPLDETPDRVVYSPSLEHSLGSEELSPGDLSQEVLVE